MLAETSEIPPVLEFHQASALPLSQVEMKNEQASLAAQKLENKGVVSNDRDEEQFDGTRFPCSSHFRTVKSVASKHYAPRVVISWIML